MLDSPDGVCAGQARFEYPATSVLFSMCSLNGVGRDLCFLLGQGRKIQGTDPRAANPRR
jgi:hypothetical protein